MDEAWEAARRISTDARQAHDAIGTALGERLDSLTGSLSQSIDRTHAQIDDAARQLDSQFEQLADQLGTLPPDSSAAAVYQIMKLREHVTTALNDMADRVSTDMAGAHTQSRTFLDSQAQEHHGFVESVLSTLLSLHGHFARHAGHVRDLRAEVTRFGDTLLPQLANVASDLRDRHAAEQGAAARAGDELVRELSGAVSALLDRQLAAHDGNARTVTEDLTAAVASFDAWDERFTPVVQEIWVGLDDVAARVTGTAVLDQLEQRRERVSTWSSTMAERLSAGPPASVESISQTVDAGLDQCDGALSRVDRLVPAWEAVLATLPSLPSNADPLAATQPIDTTLPPIPSCLLDPADTTPLPPQDNEPAEDTANDDLSVHEATPPPDPPGEFKFPYEVPEPEPGAPAGPRKRKFGRDRSPSPAGSQSPARTVVATPKRQRMQ
ncbi:hypothetical protein AMAG_19179 [Allomyces macrogynus ATCC 38327]|uniref:Uncharacterized protein n=1 Tax=Allomyces macrogynus (strain ATCC 38327) TaxID=578462 RepID=A0A0L0SSV7_ALLM3|nr:hypothetical protein AMAG_19179 [Allomyces macrogynus ATCC 38327]|eukprot:KNE65566.1 hypothetical protein AMAG_19179 [Allomyces macrogynus ATCC 38327]